MDKSLHPWFYVRLKCLSMPNFDNDLTKPLLNQGNLEVLHLTFHINVIADSGPNHDARFVHLYS